MSLNPEPADPVVRQKEHLPPKSYAAAAEEGLHNGSSTNGTIAIDDSVAEAALNYDVDDTVDEDAIKESPPRQQLFNRTASSPRPLGEVMDEIEHDGKPPGSPSLRHTRGRIEEQDHKESYADAVKHEPTAPHTVPSQREQTNGGYDGSHKVNGDRAAQEAADRKDSKDLQLTGDDAQADQLVYEDLQSKSGTNLATIQIPGSPPSNLAGLAIVDKDDSESHPELVSGRKAGAGWARSAIRWAPLNVPIQRRLQTLAVLIHTLSIVGGLALFFLLCTIPLLWPILVPYLLYVLLSRAAVDGKLSHRSDRLRSSRIWSLFAGYFPARLHRSQVLEPTRKYIFGYHPHGIISHGAFAAFATEALGFGQLFPGITNTVLTLDSNFRIPLYRDYILRMGLGSVSRENCENILTRGGPNGEGMGRAITIVIGGARESLDARPDTLRLVLKRRKGFVKLAIRTGADLVPVLSFGENDIYDQIDHDDHPYIHKMQLLVKKFMGFTVPLFHARGVFNYDVGLMPYRRPINIVTGKPIRIVQSSSPDPAYVDKVHQQYVDELTRLWDDWKDEFAPRRKGELQIIE